MGSAAQAGVTATVIKMYEHLHQPWDHELRGGTAFLLLVGGMSLSGTESGGGGGVR